MLQFHNVSYADSAIFHLNRTQFQLDVIGFMAWVQQLKSQGFSSVYSVLSLEIRLSFGRSGRFNICRGDFRIPISICRNGGNSRTVRRVISVTEIIQFIINHQAPFQFSSQILAGT